MFVPEYAIVRRSASSASASTASAASLSTGTDSPVSAASSTRSAADWISRTSAGTRTPASRATMSPATSSAAGRSTRPPSRTTCARGAAMDRSASIACSARHSCTKPSRALSTTIARIAAASIPSPITNATAAATTSTPIMKSANWRAKRTSRLCRFASGRALGPSRRRRTAASACVRPLGLDCSRASASLAFSACHAGGGPGAVQGSTAGKGRQGASSAPRRHSI